MSSILFFNDKSTLVVNELFDLLKNEFNNKQMVQVTLGNRKMVCKYCPTAERRQRNCCLTY